MTKEVNKIDAKVIEEIKRGLVEQKNQILKDLKDISTDEKVKFPDYGDKPDENAQEIGEYTTNLATDKVLEASIKDIDSALARIEDGSYGTCKYCGLPIDEKRLLARPVASACVPCKTKLQNAE